MKQPVLITEKDTLRTRPAGPATGNIWFEVNGREFPVCRWNDFVVVLLGWWAGAPLRLLRGISTQERVPFMEGPYEIELTLTPSGTLQFRALDRGAQVDEVAVGEGPGMPFIHHFISQSQEMLEACRQQAWWSRDAELLETSVMALMQEFTSPDRRSAG